MPKNLPLEVVLDASSSWSELNSLNEVVQLVIRKSKELVDGDGGAVLLLDETRGDLYFPYTAEASPDVDATLADMRVPLDQGIAGWVVHHGTADRVADAASDPRWYGAVDRETGMQTRSLLSAPLILHGKVFGVIQVRSARPDVFSAEDLTLLQALAPSITTAIDNARRFEAMQAKTESLRDQVAILRREVARRGRFADIIGSSAEMERVFALLESAISAPVTVLLQGETGTGKELIARAIHFNGPRRDEPFIAVNCAAFSEQLLETELFGHRRGAFTGALEDRKGYFEVASGGTIFLDEVGEMSPAMQTKLLRVLQNGEIIPVGERTPRKVDVRVISATNANLERAVTDGTFRADLYYRIHVYPIALPPLRQRREDIPLMARHFLKENCARLSKSVPGFSSAAMDVLEQYSWPGNIRELQNVVERAALLTPEGELISPEQLPRLTAAPAAAGQTAAATAVFAGADGNGATPLLPLRAAREEFEGRYFAAALRQNEGNVSATARAIGITRGALREKLKKYGLRPHSDES